MGIVARGKFEYWLTDDGLTLLEGWARDGLTDEQIAHNMGVAYSTFRVWKEKYSAISAVLKKSKEIVDFEVENALLDAALGGNITAQIFWLKNRQKAKWKDKPVEDTQTAALETAMRALADIIEKPVPNRKIEDFEE